MNTTGPGQAATDVPTLQDVDLERRFGALARLHGQAGYLRLRSARIAVVGLGGVGSWAVEALARCGVARLVLIDFDHVAESNINRQVQALSATLGQAKGDALRERVAGIHPGCEVRVVDDFVQPGNWPALLPGPVDALIDACDAVRAKAALAAWGIASGVPVICVGAAGGKLRPERVETADLSEVTHDPLLAALRQRLRRDAIVPRTGQTGVSCVFSRESVAAPAAPAAPDGECGIGDGTLNCHGYGSSVMVTATFGMVAASQVVARLLHDVQGAPVSVPPAATAFDGTDATVGQLSGYRSGI